MPDLQENGYYRREIANDTIAWLIAEDHFYPTKDYLNGMKWDGQDHTLPRW